MYRAVDFDRKPKAYVLDMFPYPSGEGLHVGHVEGYTATDVVSRYLRMRGKNVLHPMGWDAFGLPAENYAIQNKIHPRESVARNVERFKTQLRRLGFSYDWTREINTTDPAYYRWTQWIFLQLFNKGLAYQKEAPINFCPQDGTGLADEEVENGCCVRCGTQVERRMMRQWMLKITAYADRLLEDLDLLEWPENIKEMQRNWIGKSIGSEIMFRLTSRRTTQNGDAEPRRTFDLPVFTTRADTLFGATYVVLAPEHSLLSNQELAINNRAEIDLYIEQAKQKTDVERQEHTKSGLRLEGIAARNPVNGEEVSVLVADYVLGHYGTGAIMAVPAHDERDFAFAAEHDLPIIEVVTPSAKASEKLGEAFIEDGILVNSGEFSNLSSAEARKKITAWLAKKNLAKEAVHYKLRDWIFSRQRYWGEPIPLVFCEECKTRAEIRNPEFSEGELINPGWVAVPEEQLPVKLPDVESYAPPGTGESPLANVTDWVSTTCPKCKGPARRETHTMPQWAGSCWYYLAFAMRGMPNAQAPISKYEWNKEKIKYWMEPDGVDLYMGGAEHAVLHLLYARFWHKFLYDIDAISTTEPFHKLKNQGLILGPDGQKMSKSRGNVINPDDVIEQYGADTLRMYELFLGPLEDAKPWDTKGIIGVFRFLNKVYTLVSQNNAEQDAEQRRTILRGSALGSRKAGVQRSFASDSLMHKTIKKVTEDIERFRFNTAVSALMEYVNALSGLQPTNYQLQTLVLLLAPFAPHVAEELWQEALGKKESVHEQSWPQYDESALEEEEVMIAVQVNGKTRGQVTVRRGATEQEAKTAAEKEPAVVRHLQGKAVQRVIFVPDKLINLVVG